MDTGRDSIDLLRKLLDRFEGQLSHVIALNQLRGDAFDILELSGLQPRAEALGARFVELPRQHEPTMTKIDAAGAGLVEQGVHEPGLAIGRAHEPT